MAKKKVVLDSELIYALTPLYYQQKKKIVKEKKEKKSEEVR